MSEAQYHERINMNIIKDLIKNEVESSMLKENVSNFDASTVLAENIIQENKHNLQRKRKETRIQDNIQVLKFTYT